VSKPCVLILVENLPVPLDRRVWQEACALRDAGYKVLVICPRMRGFTEPEEILEGIHIHRHWISEEAGGFAGFFREYLSALWGETRLAWRLRREHSSRSSIVQSARFALSGRLAIQAAVWRAGHLRRPRCLARDVRSQVRSRGPFYWLVRLAERLTYACADVVLATNQSVKQVAMERGRKKPGEVFVVRTAPKVHSAGYQPDPSLKKGRRYLAGYVGVMGNADGVEYLLDAASHLVRTTGRKDVQFLIMGTGPEHPRLLAHRNELGLQEFVDMPGRVSNEFLFAALQTIDVGIACDPINPYNDHCTMNKVLEYMAFAKPQVMFDLKEGRASAGEAAVYVPENSATLLAEALDKLLDDPVRRDQMGNLGAERIRKDLNWERSVEQLLEAYQAAEARGGR
jgi:glycosyltransferase involved in cell wall biosynthesis